MLFSAVTLTYGGMAMAEPSGGVVDSGEGESLDIDLRNFLSMINRPANPITPIPSKTTTPNAITTIPDHPRHKSSENDQRDLRGDGEATSTVDADAKNDAARSDKGLGQRNISKLRFESGQIVVVPPKDKPMVNSLMNLGGVVDADSFGPTATGGAVLVRSPNGAGMPAVK
jgi:hypothetical protein